MAVSKADFSVNYYHSSKPYFGTSVIDHFNRCRTVAIWTKKKTGMANQYFSLHRYFPFSISMTSLSFAMVNFETMVMIKMTKRKKK